MSDFYYDGCKILSLKDINGLEPEIYLINGNRSSGKTTFFNRYLIKSVKSEKIRKFALLYRNKDELENISEKFFTDIKSLFFPNDNMTEKKLENGRFIELFLNDVSVGYALALSCVDKYKKYSHLFSTIDIVLFDEYQSETNRYLANEISKFLSLHKTLSRGQGKQYRKVKFILLSNTVSVVNPYFLALEISARIKSDTKFLRGDGYVCEFNMNEHAVNEYKQSGFYRAFESHEYMNYSLSNTYLNDNVSMIEKLNGSNKYLCTIVKNNKKYAIRMYYEKGLIYCDDSVDESCKLVIACDINSVNQNTYFNNKNFINGLKKYLEQGCFRFKNQICKEAVFSLFKY